MANEHYQNDLEVKVARVEEKQEALRAIVTEIKDNHLVHLAKQQEEMSEDIQKLNIKIARWTGGVGAFMLILQLIQIYLQSQK